MNDNNYKKIFEELKYKNQNLSDRDIDFYILMNGIADGRKRTINEMGQLFGITISTANKYLKRLRTIKL